MHSDHRGVLADSPVTAFVGVSDLGQAQAFYGGVLGLSLRDESPFALVAEVHGTMLRITAIAGAVDASPFTVLGWRVSAIEEVADALVARGVHFHRYEGMGQDAQGIWTAPSGARIAWFADPDGNTLSLTEDARSASPG
jgi:predicted enzyme related to lactoylglutathione lyase